MSIPEPTPPATPPASVPPPPAGMPGRVAAAIIAIQALGGIIFAVTFPLMAAQRASLSSASHIMFSVFTALLAVGLGFVARGLWQGLSWPRTATVVWLVLLLPVGWALLQAGRGALGALLLASAIVGILAVGAESKSAP